MAGQLRRVTLSSPGQHSTLTHGEHQQSVSDHSVAPHIPEPFASISAQQLVQENCRHCGMIRKESGRLKIWQDRYLILHKGCLYYYSSPEASSAQGQFSLSGYRVSCAPEKLKYQWTFKLVHLQPEKRTYHFAAHSEREMNTWMDNIQEDTAEFASFDKRNEQIVETEDDCDRDAEYSYPEVEPLFTKEDFLLLHGKHAAHSVASSQNTASDQALYCPPPEFTHSSSPQPKKRKPLPPTPARFPSSPKPVRNTLPLASQPKPTENLWQASLKKPPPVVPPRKTLKDKPLPKTPPQVPRTKPRKTVAQKYATSPATFTNQKTDMSQLIKEMNQKIVIPIQEKEDTKNSDEEYLHIVVPGDDPSSDESDADWRKKSRGYPEGKSFKSSQQEVQCLTDVLPLSAERLDLDKIAVVPLLQKRTGMYLIHSSQTAQSKQAISVCTNDRVRPYLIFYEKKLGYALDPNGPRFGMIKELITYYYDNSLPTCDCKLSRPYKA